MDKSPSSLLICHIILRLDFGGLENGLVNLINGLPEARFQHVIICLKYASDFRQRIQRQDVKIYEMHKKEGKDFSVYGRIWRLLRAIRPDIVHTRNIPTIDMLAIARLSGVKRLVHSEHGLDLMEVTGRHVKYNWIRRFSALWVCQYITVSHELADWLRRDVGIDLKFITTIHNGVDADHFRPGRREPRILPDKFADDDCILIGTIGRIAAIKDQMNLAKAFVLMLKNAPELRDCARLVIAGDGEDKPSITRLLEDEGVLSLCWLPGYRDDTDKIYRALDLFVLPSRREGISNTILEAMASGLPVIASRVGGNPEIVTDGVSGKLVASADPMALANAMLEYLRKPSLMQAHGQAGREQAVANFSMAAMINSYARVYEQT